MTATETKTDPAKELQAKVQTAIAWTESNLILSVEDRMETEERLKMKRELDAAIDAHCDPAIGQAHQLHKRLIDDKKKLKGTLPAAIEADNKAILDFNREQREAAEAKRQKEQDEENARALKIKEAAEAEENRQRLLAAEEKRKAEEALAKAQEETNAAAKRKLLAEAATAQAKASTAETKASEAEFKKETTQPAIMPAAMFNMPKTTGVSTRGTWKGEITDREKLCEFICANKRHDLIEPNQKVIDAYAKAMGKTASMPGVTFRLVETLAVSKGAK